MAKYNSLLWKRSFISIAIWWYFSEANSTFRNGGRIFQWGKIGMLWHSTTILLIVYDSCGDKLTQMSPLRTFHTIFLKGFNHHFKVLYYHVFILYHSAAAVRMTLRFFFLSSFHLTFYEWWWCKREENFLWHECRAITFYFSMR